MSRYVPKHINIAYSCTAPAAAVFNRFRSNIIECRKKNTAGVEINVDSVLRSHRKAKVLSIIIVEQVDKTLAGSR